MDESVRLIKELAKKCPMNLISINTCCPYPGTGYWYKAVKKHGEFIDFFNEGYRYFHQARPFVNISKIETEIYHRKSESIKNLVNSMNFRNRIRITLNDPMVALRKINRTVKRFNNIISDFGIGKSAKHALQTAKEDGIAPEHSI